MLLIGDIHINTRYQDKIISEMKRICLLHPEQTNIVFLGDYVYHFAYDRNALLQLYKFFLELFGEGKNLYILAGNHDRLGNSFVFEEAQKAFEIINHQTNISVSTGSIHFITKPTKHNIEGKTFLFMPFMLPEQHPLTTYTANNPDLQAISTFGTLLQQSPNKNEAFSWYLTTLLAEYIDQDPNMTIIHHYYFNGTIFPGQKSKFTYKDIALHEWFLQLPMTRYISGHLHQAFTYTTYMCTGSVRSTSSLESNQTKYIAIYTPENESIQAIPIAINPHITIEQDTLLTQEWLTTYLDHLYESNKKYFSSDKWICNIPAPEPIPLKNISLTLNVEHIDYDQIDSLITPELRKNCQDVKLKKNIKNVDTLLQNFTVNADNIHGFNDRKQILHEYIQKKFGTDYPKYEKALKELKLW